MRHSKMWSAVVGVLVLCPALFAAPEQSASSGDLEKQVLTLLEKMPAKSTTETAELSAAFVKLGPPAVARLCKPLVPVGKDADTSERYALSGLSFYTSRPGAEAERKMYASEIVKALGASDNAEVRDFLIEQLRLAGGNEAVEALEGLLGDAKLCKPAVRTLLTINPANLADTLNKALDKATDDSRDTFISALGDLKSKKAVPALVALADSPSTATRLAVWQALANIAAPEAEAVLAKAAGAPASYEQAKANAARLLYAKRLGEEGQKDKCAAYCRELIKTHGANGEIHVESAALATLAGVSGKDALKDLLAAVDSPDKKLRNAALSFAGKLEGKDVTDKCIAKLQSASPEAKAEILDMLGRRGDASALEAICGAFKDPEASVRQTAVIAASRLGGEKALPQLLDMLKSDNKEDVESVKQVLSYMRGPQVLEKVAAEIKNVSVPARAALLELIGTRGAAQYKETVFASAQDSERTVRIAAIKALGNICQEADCGKLIDLLLKAKSGDERTEAQKAIAALSKQIPDPENRAQKLLEVYASAPVESKTTILDTLPRLAGKKALETLLKESASSDEKIQNAAIRALGEWPDAAAAPELLRLAKSAPELKHQVMALRGYIRLAGQSDVDGKEKIKMYRTALDLTTRTEERQLVIAGLGDMKAPEALKMAAQFLNDPALQQDAALAVVDIAMPRKRAGELKSLEAVEALKKALPFLQDEQLKKDVIKKISNYYYEMEVNQPQADAEGYVPLFNGKDLAGWTGAVDGYDVVDGTIVCVAERGGKLFTERQYGDFDLRFDFKLTPGANNGIGIRTPLDGDPAYVGMEIQVLDNTSDQYKTLHPYQYHGSVYGIAPAKREYLKPVGEWNSEQIVAKGRHITVKLNGETITDVNLDEVTSAGTADHKDHPGLKRKSGHIGFLGHGSEVAFRNIKVKELLNEAPEGFVPLYNGKDLSGWKGLVENPIKRAQMSAEQMAEAQKKADDEMNQHWKSVNGTLVYDGQGSHLCTSRDYSDFEMLVDWKIGPHGDSGIYLRGSPQVQIWDPEQWKQGSGGLYNNQKSTSGTLKIADNPIGDWNTFRIKMVGDKVTVHLNDELVVDNVPLENYWDRNQSMFPVGQIELQNHGNPLFFRNIFICELGEKK